ncbi:MAG TPA: tRNA (adenosine(37)-N6)-threonylcarbamoyltransferase complex dimerization subunit type 1 TsaB, partial [Bacillales bacterium]|nr:tRNA (adenosine(37)-N6)-threonylcarbamoyltransferase complex dimerization subunit type 1 TsaB [Bacillales bacterium]
YFDGLVCPLFDARRGQVYTGLYGNVDGRFQLVQEERSILLTEWLEMLHEDSKRILFLGNDLGIHRQAIEEILGDRAIFGQSSDLNPRASELASIGIERDTEDPHTFTPSYLRLAEAEAKWLESQKK